MPNLEEFQAGSGQLNISDRGAESFAQAGRRAGVAFEQIGNETAKTIDVYHQHQVDMDTSNTLTQQSNATVGAMKDLMTVTSDPQAADHPELGQAAVDRYRQSLLDINSHASTDEARKIGERRMAELTQQFSDHVASQMSILAGAKAAQNFETYTNNNANLAVDDPSSLPRLLQDEESHHDLARPHNLTAEGAAQYDELLSKSQARITLAAYVSAAHLGEQQIANGLPPTALDAAQKMLDSGVGMDVAGVDKATLQERLEVARTQGAERLKVGQAAQKAATAEDTKAELGKLRIAMLPDANGQPPDPRVASQVLARLHQLAQSTDPVVAATAGQEAESFGTMIKTQAEDRLTGKLTTDDPSAVSEINQRKVIAPGQPGALTKVMLDDLRSSHRISDTTYQEQTRRLDDLTSNPNLRQTEERLTSFMHTSIEHQLTHGADPAMASGAPNLFASTVDPTGYAAFGIALNQSVAEFEARVANGASPEEAYKSLTDPGSTSSVWHMVPAWSVYAQQGPGYAADHPITFGNGPQAAAAGAAPPAGGAPALPTPQGDAMARARANKIKPGESPGDYLKRIGG